MESHPSIVRQCSTSKTNDGPLNSGGMETANRFLHNLQGLVADARYKRLNDKKLILTRFLPLMLVPTLLLVGAGAILLSFRMNEFVYKSTLLFGSLAGYMAFELPMMRRFLSLATKDLQFRADKKATDIVGTEALLRALERIDRMRMDRLLQFESLLGIGTSARQRIEKLQNYSTRSGQELL